MAGTPGRLDPRIAVALGAILSLTVLVYLPALGGAFVWDDFEYVVENPQVRGGLDVEGASWALTAMHAKNWHPLTWLSHMADVELFGIEPRGHHATSLVLHVAAALVLFGLWRSATGEPWAALAVTGLFALHPVRVESVAWVAERKDVLSAVVGLLALWAWVAWTRRPSNGRYALVLLLLALGLAAKPMLVTLPLVMLLLDAWPLGRFSQRAGATRLVVEKLPLLALSAVSATLTLVAQRAGGAVIATDSVSVVERMQHAVASFVLYAMQQAWPAGLSPLHPHPYLPGGEPWSAWQVAGAAVLLVAAAAAAVVAWPRRPYVLVGGAWFAGMLVPVIGLVQVGVQGMADRYAYLPAIGLYVVVVHGALDLLRHRSASRRAGPLMAAGLGLVLATFAALTAAQTRYWRDPVALFGRALAVSSANPVAATNLGDALVRAGRHAEAIEPLREAVRLNPDYALARHNLGVALAETGKSDEAEAQFRAALALNDGMAVAHRGLAGLLRVRGELAEAERHYRRAAGLGPPEAGLLNDLAVTLQAQGDFAGAIPLYRQALALRPAAVDTRLNLALALQSAGAGEEALAQLDRARELEPDRATVHDARGVVLAGLGRLPEAIAAFEQALRLDPSAAAARRHLELARARLAGGAGG